MLIIKINYNLNLTLNIRNILISHIHYVAGLILCFAVSLCALNNNADTGLHSTGRWNWHHVLSDT